MQYLKEDVQQRISDAALALFAERGFEATSIADVAKRAGIATGNVYRYYENKQALFDDATDAAHWVALFEKRFAAARRGLGAEWRTLADEMRELAVTERQKVIVLLRHDQAFVSRLVTLCAQRCAEHFGVSVSLPLRVVYANLFEAIAQILEQGGGVEEIARYNRYHLAGLEALHAQVV